MPSSGGKRHVRCVEKLRERIVENLRDAVVVTDADGRTILMNRAARELGIEVDWLLQHDALARGRAGTTEVSAADSMGTPRLLAIECAREGDALVFVIRDMTLVRGRTGVAVDPSVIHDFNNLLTALVAASSVLRTQVAPGSREEALAHEIHGIGERAACLARRALVSARRQRESERPFDVSATVLELQPLLRRVAGEHVSLSVECDVLAGHVIASRERLEEVLVNLVANARDATPRGGSIMVSTAYVALAGDPSAPHPTSYVAITVADTGVGMSADVRDRVFEPFFTTKPLGLGTGLGLPSAQRFASESGGLITVKSELNHGTAVLLYLPRVEPRAE